MYNNSSKTERPTIGVALSGGSSRAIAHIGALEVLQENNIPIDYLVGCSSGAFVAVSFCAGTMEELKTWIHSARLSSIFALSSFKGTKGGLFNLNQVKEMLEKVINGLTFEKSYPKLGLVAADVNSGELLTISWGDVETAIKASCAVPGLFEPVVWGNKVLVDGGLVNIVPTVPVKQMGADVVIGINVSGARFIYEKKLPLWRRYKSLIKLLGIEYGADKLVTIKDIIFKRFNWESLDEEQLGNPSILKIIAKALDHSMRISDQWTDADMACDVMINPEVKQYRKAELKELDKIYDEGRRAALEALPQIQQLIADYEKNKVKELV